MSGNRVQVAIGNRFRRVITNTPDGVPPWLDAIADGDDAGMFLPTDAPWVVHSDLATLVGGIRALLVQALHPGSLAGVAEHSRYEQDPLGRLAGTTKWLTITTFGSRRAIENESRRVNTMHTRVTGTYEDGTGAQITYQAAQPNLLMWVHIAFTESFLATHLLYGSSPIPGGPDGYVRLWAQAVVPLGLTDAPKSVTELNQVIDDYLARAMLRVDDRTREIVGFIAHPPLSWFARRVYALLFQAAVVSLPTQFRELLGMRTLPSWLVIPCTRGLLRVMRTALGPHSPLEEAALGRLTRLGVLPSA